MAPSGGSSELTDNYLVPGSHVAPEIKALQAQGVQFTDMDMVAEFIDRAIHAKGDAAKLAAIRNEVAEFAAKFPMPH